jgi:hypothetical protein
MSTVIIGAGGHARDAITHLENVSVGFSKTQQDHAQAFLDAFTAQCEAYANNPSTL